MYLHINNYYKAVCEAHRLGNIESSYNAPIIQLFNALGCAARDLSGARGGEKGENIDIKLWHTDTDTQETEPFAGIEVKKIGGIDARAKEQIKAEAARYGAAILTDNLVWEFWRAGDDKMFAGVRLMELKDGEPRLKKENIELFIGLVSDFLLQAPAQIKSADKLAEYMALNARTIRACIAGILKDDGAGNPLDDERQRSLPMFAELCGLYFRIKTELTPTLKTADFADMYAQTITYGLFIARYNDTKPETFDRYEAIGYLREESALLSRFFSHIASQEARHPTLDGVIDKLCELYALCDISTLLESGKNEDCIIHFYETFLTFYDPALRKSLGVFYTPAPAARCLIAMADKALKEDFGIQGGLSNNDIVTVKVPVTIREAASRRGTRAASNRPHTETETVKEITTPRVAILDPACGTGSFPAEIIRYVKNTYFTGGRELFYKSYIESENGLLSRLIGFEIMMTSYAVAHLKIRRTVDETLGAKSLKNQRARIYLTNTLSAPHSLTETQGQLSLMDFSAAITDEAYKADTWKARRPIKVIIGNPPYLAASTNPYDISAYKTETDGVTEIKAKNLMNLGDDYVKFFRFAQNIIDKHGEGVLAFVSNNGYLDNINFRGMRASLLRTFDKIYIVNLHGNARKQEKPPNGGKDENIFDIMQGVALFVGVKTESPAKSVVEMGTKPVRTQWARIYHADLWGTREEKFKALESGEIDFIEITPDEKMAYLLPISQEGLEAYEQGISMAELFPKTVVGMESGRDEMCVQRSYNGVKQVINDFHTKNTEELRDLYNLGKDTSGWTVADAKKDVETGDGKIVQVAYRPFDTRWTYYTGRSKGFHRRPRGGLMEELLQPPATPIGRNVGLIFTCGDSTPNDFSMIFISDTIIDNRITAAQTAGLAYIAPLYLKAEVPPVGEGLAPPALHTGSDTGGASPSPTETPANICGVRAAGSPQIPERSEERICGVYANFSPAALARLTEHISFTPEPIEIFDYIYGILHSPAYRKKYNEYLKRGFPRVPVINKKSDKDNPAAFYVSEEAFCAYVKAGSRLRRLHLLQEKKPAALAIEPPTPDNMEIEQIKYRDNALYINKNKRITGITPEVWNFRIGGYQVLDKWFKSHKGETFTIEHFDHISNVAGLLWETIKIQTELAGIDGTAD